MVSSIAPPVSAHSVQTRSGHPSDRGAGITGSHTNSADNIPAYSPIEAIRRSATKTSGPSRSVDQKPRSQMIRDLLGIRRNGTPENGSDSQAGNGSRSTMRMDRDGSGLAPIPRGIIDPNMPRSEMIKMTLGLGPYAEGLTDCDGLPAVARMMEFCVSLLGQYRDRALQMLIIPWHLDVLA